MAREKRIYAVVWTWRHNRRVVTKKRGTQKMRVWKRWYERQGWSVHSLGSDAYAATSPDGETRHSIVFHEYDENNERVYKELRPKAAPVVRDPTVAPKRVGRATPAWA